LKKLKRIISPFIPAAVKEALGRKVYDDRPSSLRLGRFGGFQIAYRKGTADEAVIQDCFDHASIFDVVPEYLPASAHIIVDIGAHIGTFSLLASSKVPLGRVYAIEPCVDTFNFLQVNVALNHATNISVHRIAILDKRGTVTLSYDSGNWGHSVVRKLSRWGEQVPACSLTDFMTENGIEHCDFMKFNCEGAEFPIILNTPPAVLGKCGAMLVQYHGDLWQRNSAQELISHLTASGFKCDVCNRSLKRGWIVATKSGSSASTIGYSV
jgi:FkbM family methyltransferase